MAETDPLDLAGALPRAAPARAAPVLSELDLAMMLCMNSLARWLVRCMATAGRPGMAPLEILILQHCAAGSEPLRFGAICEALGIADPHQARYAIRKLAAAGLVATARRGKEKTVTPTEEGRRLCADCEAIRESLMLRAARDASAGTDLAHLVQAIRALSGAYDRASHATAGW